MERPSHSFRTVDRAIRNGARRAATARPGSDPPVDSVSTDGGAQLDFALWKAEGEVNASVPAPRDPSPHRAEPARSSIEALIEQLPGRHEGPSRRRSPGPAYSAVTPGAGGGSSERDVLDRALQQLKTAEA